MYLKNRKQAGVSLVESMIALLVISIGLLGIAALQITAMKQNATALNHSQAVWIAYDMADRIRANITEFDGYRIVDTKTNNFTQDCMGSACSTGDLIKSDAADWKTQVQNLPGGRGRITGNASQIVIAVMWDDEGTGATGTGCGNNPAVDLTCYTVTMVQ